MKQFKLIYISVITLAFAGCSSVPKVEDVPKPRMIITCDPELDDNNSLIRYILHSSDFRTEALIYASSEHHFKGDGKGGTWYREGTVYDRFNKQYNMGIGPMDHWRWDPDCRFIDDVVDAYEQCYPNLKTHNPEYPTPQELRSKVYWGNVAFEGDMSEETEGSNAIKAIFLDDEPGPVFTNAWGGASTIARALKSIQEEYEGTDQWESIRKKINGKVVLCLSGDQDRTYADYIQPNWPDIPYQRLMGGTFPCAYNAPSACPPQDTIYYNPDFMSKYIVKGPLGSLEYTWGCGRQMAKGDWLDYFWEENKTVEELEAMGYKVWMPVQKKGTFVAEGDDGCFLNQFDNGLRAWQDPTWGGWAGRQFELPQSDGASRGGFFMRAKDPAEPDDYIPAAQNDLAGRIAWSITPAYGDANHFPIIAGPLSFTAKAGQTVKTKFKVTDPDGNNVNLSWRYFKVGTCEGDVTIANPSEESVVFTVPADAKSGDTIHLLLTATDDDPEIPLTRYHRLVVTVK